MKYGAITVIYNPQSTGSSEALARVFKRDMAARFPRQKVSLRPTKYAGHAEKLAYTLAKQAKHPLILSSSGDGGYHEVINGIMKANQEGFGAVAGLLPAGNANDHYRNLHDEDLIGQIAKGDEKNIDVLTLHGVVKGKPIQRYGHSYIGFGLTPSIGRKLNKNKLNFFNQIWIVAKGLFTIKAVKLNLGKEARYYDSVVFSNVTTMSKYLKISRSSRVDDGKFEITAFRKRKKAGLIALLLKTSISGVTEDMQASTFSLQVIKKTSVQIDGEILLLDAHSKVTISIEKRALSCVV